MANRTLEVRVVRVTSGVTTVIGEVVGGQINVSYALEDEPGSGTHTYKIQVRDDTGFYTGKINRRSIVIFRAKR